MEKSVNVTIPETQHVAVKVDGLVKTYGSVRAADGVCFDVTAGTIFGLLGPNGAGKTTTLECLEGLRQPDKGELRIAGIDPQTKRKDLAHVIGVQLQRSGLPGSVTVSEAMTFVCAYHGIKPRTDLIERFDLVGAENATYQSLSTGNQRRLDLALAVAHDPSVVILDEPTAGLDVASRRKLHEIMREMRAAGTTILLSTHDMAEAETMSDQVAILLSGKIVASGTPREITAAGSGFTKVSVRTSNSSLIKNEATLSAGESPIVQDEYLVCFTRDISATLESILAEINARNDELIDMRVERPSLEERFLELTSQSDGNGGIE